ncbi:MAG: tyrosine-type recombinase/integrase [Ilumatobacteraceae bacterium]|nr:tyrosine-type recombinase/integrase [Ilumatobacteraceae bacterium]MDW3215241.1 tyrosine-type recombinase/integrase [Ilumatobacteraceae bacterium]MDW3216745.1 tyrosine-type recombinase/integrase [Ilumatobacteraceae bacterium]
MKPISFPKLTLPDPGSRVAPTLGHRLVDDYLESVHARLRPNSTLAVVYDLKVFFTVIDVDPLDVRRRHVLEFIRVQRTGSAHATVVPMDQSDGLALSTIRRRLSTLAGFYAHLVALGELDHNPVQRGMPVRAPVTRDRRVIPLVRPIRHLPQILDHDDVNKLVGALRKERDRAMIDAMLLAGLRRCEVLGLRLQDIRWGERRLFIADGKGGHQRIVPISPRFFDTLRRYLDNERPADAETPFVFVVLKGPNRGRPLTAKGLDEIMLGARTRAGLEHATCHELRHTCFTRLREAGMALEALQAQAGHRSISATQIYLHLANDWLAGEYIRAAQAVDAQAALGRQVVAS